MTTFLETYGLEAFDIDATADLNSKLAKAVRAVYAAEMEEGVLALKGVLTELAEKSEALMDERSNGYRMGAEIGPTAERRRALTKAVFNVLQEAGGLTDIVLTATEMRRAWYVAINEFGSETSRGFANTWVFVRFHARADRDRFMAATPNVSAEAYDSWADLAASMGIAKAGVYQGLEVTTAGKVYRHYPAGNPLYLGHLVYNDDCELPVYVVSATPRGRARLETH